MPFQKGHKGFKIKNFQIKERIKKIPKEKNIQSHNCLTCNSLIKNKNKFCCKECRCRKHSEETKQKMRGKPRLILHHERILQEIPELEKQGFRCIPNTKIIPDIIAIKDNKVYAIEVEYQKPDYNKYTDCKLYDDIIWVIRKKK